MTSQAAEDAKFMAMAYDEARLGASESGVPIGAVLVSRDGTVLGRGHNMRVQRSSATLHAEISALENAGRLPARAYVGATMYTTLSPCIMCTGACLLYKVKRVVMGENESFVGGESLLQERGVEVVNLKHDGCRQLMVKYMKENADEWNEDIGE